VWGQGIESMVFKSGYGDKNDLESLRKREEIKSQKLLKISLKNYVDFISNFSG